MTYHSDKLIMVVEDSPEDFEALRRSFKRARMKNRIAHFEDGDTALDYLFRRGPYADSNLPRPAIILLDLNLPGTDGRQVLAELKQSDALRRIPVVVLTTSSDKRDVDTCYALGANSYIVKPVEMQGFVEALKRLSGYWFEIVILPEEAE